MADRIALAVASDSAHAFSRDVLGTVRRRCEVQPVLVDTHDRGLDVAERYRRSVYDAMIVASAREAGCTILYTEDLQDGLVIVGVTIRNPFQS